MVARKPRFGEAGLFGAPPRVIGIGPGQFELVDQHVLFGLEGEGIELADGECAAPAP